METCLSVLVLKTVCSETDVTLPTKGPHCCLAECTYWKTQLSYTQRLSYVSHGNFRAYTDLVNNLIQYLDTIGYISHLRLIHLG